MVARKTKTGKGAALRNRLLEEARRLLAQGQTAASLSPERMAQAAGIRPSQFKAAYPDHQDFLVDLLQQLSEIVRTETVRAIAGRKPEPALIVEGLDRYLDIVLQHPATLEIRTLLGAHPGCLQISRDRLRSLTSMATLLLQMTGRENARGIAELGTAMLLEVVQAEHETRRALPEYRHTIQAFFLGA